MIQKMINGFIVILIGSYLMPEVARQVKYCNTESIIQIEEKPHRQTYLEYVKERLEIEKLMK
jgi:hypothetical protein